MTTLLGPAETGPEDILNEMQELDGNLTNMEDMFMLATAVMDVNQADY